jgi:hypothetical protein
VAVLKGPRLNNISKSFTTRDSLGIEGVATTIQAEICPVVNTVTPRAFYWPFMVWTYFDFYKYSGIEERTYTAFNKYLKRQDYFFVLATLLTPGADRNGLVGRLQAEQDILNNPNGPYEFNPQYFVSRFGGMMYYNAGCLSMYFVVDHDPETGKEYGFPVLRKEGEQMALAFESVIKETEYFKKYRRNDSAVPRDALEEFGKVIKFNLNGFEECKSLLRKYMFEDERAIQLSNRSKLLTDSCNYVKYIVNKCKVSELGRDVCRQIFYDLQLPSGENIVIPDDIQQVANKWEIVVGRQYFTSGLEMIWKYMLDQLITPMTLKQWIEYVLNISEFSWDLDGRLEEIISECDYSFSDREKMINNASRGVDSTSSVENGLRVILSVYNRFLDRDDMGEEKAFFTYGIDSQSISFTELFEKIERYKQKSIKEFFVFIMQQWLVEQHYNTSFNKMLQNRDGFYYEYIDGLYIWKYGFDMRFQDIRMTSLMQVMTDLNML